MSNPSGFVGGGCGGVGSGNLEGRGVTQLHGAPRDRAVARGAFPGELGIGEGGVEAVVVGEDEVAAVFHIGVEDDGLSGGGGGNIGGGDGGEGAGS